ncbi:plasmalemma vesicle associated protein b [Hoplias malabaricus]|uniref:plasmalemma vesicle associated protein b n=1 Tax=Hoplias malabaricus TaxID=27720 RepID=UPI0034617FAE
MYNNSYSRPKVALEKKVIHKSKGKSCGYYLRIVFFFSSLIQSLIIVSLVLFLVYGQPGKSPEEMRVEELEIGYNKLSLDNTKLRKEKAELTTLLKTKTTEKDTADKKLAKLTIDFEAAKSNNTRLAHQLSVCKQPQSRIVPPAPCSPGAPSPGHLKSLQNLLDHQKALYVMLESNYTLTVQSLKLDLERATKEKTLCEISVTHLKQEKEDLASQLQLFRKKCKDDFVSSLRDIQTVSAAFLEKIDNLFPASFTFLLTCAKQQEQMERIQANCTNLSRQVENKFQSYLNVVGEKVSEMQAQSSHLEVQNRRLTSDLQQCSQSRTQENEKCKKLLVESQEAQDREVERLLKLQETLIQEKLQALCPAKPAPPTLPRSSGYVYPTSLGHHSRIGTSSAGASAAGHTAVGSSQP